MPSTTLDVVRAAVSQSLGKKNDMPKLETQLTESAKKAILFTMQFEDGESYQTSVLTALKSKYIVLKAPEMQAKSSIREQESERFDETGNAKHSIKHELYPMEKVYLGWSKTLSEWSVGAGMVNIGNTCYLNSTLQALFHVPSLVNWLMSDKEHVAECQDTGVCIICAMRKTLIDSQQRHVSSIRPLLIYNKLRLLCKNLIPGRQEDAHEFLRYLVEAMEKSFLQRFKNHDQIDVKLKETTPLNQILGGYLRTAVRCLKCGHVSTTFQHFQDLLLDIRKAQTLDEAMDLYFSREKLDDDSYHCEACQKKVQATKQFQLERVPNVLCIQLKRFSVSNNKLAKHVAFKQRLDISRFTKQKTAAPIIYRLVSMVTHMGPTVSCGHYTAVAQSPSGNFYQFDDSMVRPISHQSVFSTNAYIMLYELEPASRLQRNNLQPCAKSNATSTITTEPVPVRSKILTTSTPIKDDQRLNPSSTPAPKLPLGIGFTSDKVYGPELPPDRNTVTSTLTNGKARLVSSSTSTASDLTDESGSESSEEEHSSKVSCPSAHRKKEADSSTATHERAFSESVKSENCRDASPGSSSVVSTSVSSLSSPEVATTSSKKVSATTSKSLVPYDTGDTSGSEDSNHSDTNRVNTKATLGEWQVTSTTDIGLQNNRQWVKRQFAESSSGNVVSELFKMSTAGYSAPVSTWEGNRSQLDKEVQQERRDDRKRSADSSIDQGRAKHAKVSSSFSKGKSNPGYNPVQECHNMKNWSNSNGSSGSNHYHHNNKPYYHGNRHKRNFRQGNRGGFHKSYRFR